MRLEIKIPYNINSINKIEENLNSIKNLKNITHQEKLTVFIMTILTIR